MGFDDELHSTQFEAKLKELLKPHIDTYVIQTMKVEGKKDSFHISVDVNILKKWEEKICYNGYSLAYHTLLPVITVFVLGSCPCELTDEHHEFIKMRTREEAMKLFTLTGT